MFGDGDKEETMRSKRRRPQTGTVLGALALIVALAGGTFAVASPRVIVRKGEIGKGAVTAKTLAREAVHAKALAKGAVHPKALAAGAVGAAALRSGAVGAAALGRDAVGANALAPGSVYGGALGAVTLHTAGIVDLDAVAHNGEWTVSEPAVALCQAGERVLSGGVVFTKTGDNQIGIVATQAVLNGPSNGWAGQITSDAGGAAVAEVQALCLK